MLYDFRKEPAKEFGKFKDYSFDRLKKYHERKYKINILVLSDLDFRPFPNGFYAVYKGVSCIFIKEHPDEFQMKYTLLHEVGHHLHGMEERSANFYALETLFCPKTLVQCLLNNTPIEIVPERLKMPPFYFYRLLEYYDGKRLQMPRYTLYFGHYLQVYDNKKKEWVNLDDF